MSDVSNNNQEAILLLEDGKVFRGKAAGKIGTTTGEICFNTGMTGYQEVFTDPSYYKQIIVMTGVHIGNYGTKDSEVESGSMKIAGMVCRNFNEHYSRPQGDHSIQEYFENEGTVAISDIDTRAVVRYVRDRGAMNCIISSEILDVEELKKKLAEVPSMEGMELSSIVSTKEAYELGDANADYKVAVLDLGVKTNILNCMLERGCKLKVFPAKTSFAEMAEWEPNGFFISNGPGDPASMPYAIDTVKEILANDYPLFGICLGHQMLSIASGLTTYKMHNGHRGLNHPIKNLITGTSEVTSQNHGFCVSQVGLEGNTEVEMTHINLNDDTLAGIRLKNKDAFSVQYHPEASPGPHDSRYLFDDFVNMMKGAAVFQTGRVDLQLA
jgi:carbamoyl-phosphate synthase small subunit